MDSRERAGLQKRGEQQEAPSDSLGRRRTGPWQRGSARCRGHRRSPAAHTLGSSPGILRGFPAGRGRSCGQGPTVQSFQGLILRKHPERQLLRVVYSRSQQPYLSQNGDSPTVRSALIGFLRAQLSCPTPAFIGG